MKFETYDIIDTDAFLHYDFFSYGRNGIIAKHVEYRPMVENEAIFTLSFGDSKHGDEFDDAIVTNNGDTGKVLATVAATALRFFDIYPDKWILFAGNTHARNRLYRMALSNNIELIEEKFELYGLVDDEFHVFEKGIDYSAFIIKQKL